MTMTDAASNLVAVPRTEPLPGPGAPVLETDRLRLRSLRESDFEDFAALCADPEVARFLTRGVFSRYQAWGCLAFMIGHWQMRGTGMWAVERKETGDFLGLIGFADPEGWPGFELAWTLVRRWWGHGYATEGARAALAHAFDVWRIHPGNQASLRVAERLGESLQGRTQVAGKEFLVYGIDREGAATPPAAC